MKGFGVTYENQLQIRLGGLEKGKPHITFYDIEDGELLTLDVEIVDASKSDDVVWFELRSES